MIELSNDFHGTSITVRAKPGEKLSQYQARKIGKALCGMSDCYCSGPLGIKGRQDYYVDEVYDSLTGRTSYIVLKED